MKYSILGKFAIAALCASAVACGNAGPDRAAETERAMKLAGAACPPSMPVDAARMNLVLGDSALNPAYLKTLNDAGVAVCLDRAMPNAKKRVYGHGPFAIFQPAAKGQGAILRLWDDGGPPIGNIPFQTANGINRYSYQAIHGAAEIIEGKKADFQMKPDTLSIATDSYGCITYRKCFGIHWEPAENHRELIERNPDLFPGGLPAPAATPVK